MTEDKLQIQVMRFLKLKIHGSVILYHVANEFKGSRKAGGKRKKMGVTTGVPDIVINWSKENQKESIFERTVYIELKKPATYKVSPKTGRLIIDKPCGAMTNEQNNFKKKCDDMLIPYFIAYSLDDVAKIIKKMKIPLKG